MGLGLRTSILILMYNAAVPHVLFYGRHTIAMLKFLNNSNNAHSVLSLLSVDKTL